MSLINVAMAVEDEIALLDGEDQIRWLERLADWAYGHADAIQTNLDFLAYEDSLKALGDDHWGVTAEAEPDEEDDEHICVTCRVDQIEDSLDEQSASIDELYDLMEGLGLQIAHLKDRVASDFHDVVRKYAFGEHGQYAVSNCLDDIF